jgi:hypothetical protein
MSRQVRNFGDAGRSSWPPSRRMTSHATAASGNSRTSAPSAGSMCGAAERSVMLTIV